MSKEQLELFSVSVSNAQPEADKSPRTAKLSTKSKTSSKAGKKPSVRSQAPAQKRRTESQSSKEDHPVYLTVRNVAARYEVCVPTIWRWIKTAPGFPAPRKIGPGTTRWSLEDLLRYERGIPSSVNGERP